MNFKALQTHINTLAEYPITFRLSHGGFLQVMSGNDKETRTITIDREWFKYDVLDKETGRYKDLLEIYVKPQRPVLAKAKKAVYDLAFPAVQF